eukprot:s3129_g1.t1
MFLSETERFVRARGSTTALGEKVWEAICHEVKGTKNQLPFFRHGLLKLALTGMHLSATDCKRVFSNSSMVGKAVKADGLMSQLRGMATQAKPEALAEQNLVNVLGVVDSNLVAHVMSLQVADEKKYKSLEGICHDAVSIVAGVLGVPIDSPWEAQAETLAVASASSGKAAARLVELNSDGSMKSPGAILEGMNIIVGSCVRRRKDKMECEILAIDTSVKLKSLADGRAMRAHMDSFIRGEWQVFTPKAEVHEIEDLQPFGPLSAHPDFDVAHTVAMIHCEMHSLVENQDMHDTMAKLKLCIRPTKLVSKTAVPKGKLILVPFSTKVVARSSTETMQGAVEVTLKKGCHDRRFFIAATNIMPKASEDAPDQLVGFLSPFFLVQSVEDQSQANMTIVLSGNKQTDIRIPMLKN